MKKITAVITIIYTVVQLNAQNTITNQNFGVEITGFVKNDVFYDTRQNVSAREGHFLLWPSAEMIDENGQDINARSSLNMLAIQSRLSCKITGPDALNAKTSGVIEGDFFSQANDNINLLRLRHAYIKLNWEKTEVLTGQTWNPLFVTGCFPGTVSFNTGTPLQSFARNPQIRITHRMGRISIIGAALAQRDYVTAGPSGNSSEYLRNAVLPDMHLQLQYNTKNEASGINFLAGAGMAFKAVVPRLYNTITDSLGSHNYRVDEKVNGLTSIAYFNLKIPVLTIKMQYRYGENISDILSVSGFAVKNIVDATTGELSYTPLKNTTFWGEVHTNGKEFQFGIFGGILINNGTKEKMSSTLNTVYGLTTNIESLYRIAPRIIYNSGKFRAAFELEYTSADYGNDYNLNYIPNSVKTVANIRALFSTYYFF